MRIAVLFSPGAGSNSRFQEIGSLLSERLSNHEVYTCPSYCGKLYLPDAAQTGKDIARDYKESIRKLTISLAEIVPELFICIGGDGLAAYIADTLVTKGYKVPLMGIAGGTANVGPIISVQPGSLNSFSPEKLAITSVGAIRVTNGQCHIAYAFNDVIIGDTFLGTVDGNMTNLSVEALVENNEKVIANPSGDITSEGFSILKNGRNTQFSIERPAQIIVSPLEVDRFYGRAITGALCYSAYLPLKAAIGLSDEILVKMDDNRGDTCFTKMEHMLFGPRDLVSISGLTEKGHMVVDGNPYMRVEEAVTFEYIPGILEIARPVF